ncbi:DUF4440 domain-containing protein [Salinimicrobium flavum]
MYRLLPFLALLLAFGACQDKEREEPETDDMMAEEEYADPDQVIADWNDAWNSNDPQMVDDMIADDAVLILDGQHVEQQDSIMSWMEKTSMYMKDLNMKSQKKGTGDMMAYDVGSYTHTYTNDSTQYKGFYTFIWERDGSEWQVKVLNISDVKDKDSISNQ